ncbi:MAG: M20/M25/M40 family metallo-hydrolase [Opitutales bacterium]|nr:M20/M25/M40 family metallo-hydrolase [Opitutales bacterium]
MFDPVKVVSDFIRFPSVSTDPAFAEGMLGARDYIANLLKSMGLEVDILDTPLHPLVRARRTGPEDWPHVLIYGHYDVQPADPLELWSSPAFEPEIRNGRLYGRGSADNKGPMMVHIAAAARLLESDPNAPIRFTFLIEGEEEIGSPSFPGILERYKDELKADFVLLSDTLSPSTEQIAITTGLRGLTALEVEVTGPRSDLHSGINGGAVYNPIQALSEILASMHDANNRVTVPGFYDDVIPAGDWERSEIARIGSAEDYAKQLDIEAFHTIDGISPFEATRLMPTLEFNGITGGYQGKGDKTIVPSRASAKITCRLVANQQEEDILNKVVRTLEERCPKGIRMRIHRGKGGPPYQVVPPDRENTPAEQNPHLARAFRAADKAIATHFPNAPLYLREGGSIPIIGQINNILEMDSLMIGMFTPADNLHAPDESFDLKMFERGIAASEQMLRELITAR